MSPSGNRRTCSVSACTTVRVARPASPVGASRRRASALGIAPLAHWAGQQIGLAVPTKRAQDCLEALVHGATRQGWSEGSDDAMTS